MKTIKLAATVAVLASTLFANVAAAQDNSTAKVVFCTGRAELYQFVALLREAGLSVPQINAETKRNYSTMNDLVMQAALDRVAEHGDLVHLSNKTLRKHVYLECMGSK
jgi:hypothetical protein